MYSSAETVDNYIFNLPADRQIAISNLRKIILQNLADGFEECMSYGMIGYVVPHSKYPAGYHCNPKLPLGFINLASQKNFIAIYHMGIYGSSDLLKWFQTEHAKVSTKKMDMGKSCIRYKKMEDIPYELIGKLCSKLTVDEWIKSYEKMVKK